MKETNIVTRKFEGVAKHNLETKFLNLEVPKQEETKLDVENKSYNHSILQ
jgi:hypothetical protein